MCYGIRRAERLNLWQATQRAIYQRVQDYEDLRFRVTDGGRSIHAHNPTGRTIEELMVETSVLLGAPEQEGPDALGAGAVADEVETDQKVEYSSLRLEAGHGSDEDTLPSAHRQESFLYTAAVVAGGFLYGPPGGRRPSTSFCSPGQQQEYAFCRREIRARVRRAYHQGVRDSLSRLGGAGVCAGRSRSCRSGRG